jgi:peptidoglycan/LPS O-acetylase OafA/YrhL
MYFPLLDILRFLSSVAVFFHHTFSFHYGKLGVYLFFIISGFVIHFSLQKGVKNFVIGRFVRLYPLFWFCCTLTYIVTLLYGNSVPIHKYAVNMLMFNDGKIATMVDGSYWTLTFELLFYAYCAVFISFSSSKKIEWFYISWLFVAFLSFAFKVDQLLIFKLLSVRFAPYFVFGGMLALCVDKYKTSTKNMKALYMGTLVLSALLPVYVSSMLRAQIGSISNFTGSFEKDELIIVESFFIIFPIVLYLSKITFLRKKAVAKISFFLGGITYPLYLLHWKIGDTIISHHRYMYGVVNKFTVLIAFFIFVFAVIISLADIKLRHYLKRRFLGKE